MYKPPELLLCPIIPGGCAWPKTPTRSAGPTLFVRLERLWMSAPPTEYASTFTPAREMARALKASLSLGPQWVEVLTS
jgi:hypothetical protein